LFDPTVERTAAAPLHYRWVGQDFGGTYTHTIDPPPDVGESIDELNLPAIGTSQCRTCVGVYMQISPTSCFIAHINAAHVRPSWHHSKHATNRYNNRIVTEAEGAYVQEEVTRRLREESYRSDWPPVEEIERVWLVCPMMRFQGKKLSGTYIVEGVRDFLRRDNFTVDKWSEGFVVKFSDDESITSFPIQQPGDGRLMLPDDGVNYVGHYLDEDEPPRWFISIGALWQERRFLGRSEHVRVEGQDGRTWTRRWRRWSV
jgi:hypothetical protein